MSQDLVQSPWQQSLRHAITDWQTLLNLLALREEDCSLIRQSKFPLWVTREFVSRMEKGNPHDPLLRQVLPVTAEDDVFPGYSQDPLAEKESSPIPGLLHKYHGRVLLVLTGRCAINCRYCFRRHFPYSDHAISRTDWNNVLNYIRERPSINEVIWSGGDPLLIKDQRLAALVADLEQIPHVKRLRIHTRLPIVIPSRIDSTFLGWMSKTRLQPVMVIHCNHAKELDKEVVASIQALRGISVPIFNQAVLLKGVNDSLQTLVDLSESLFKIGIIPYYLHLLDAVLGAAHFNVDKDAAIALWKGMTESLPGYMVPKLVQELPGYASKYWVGAHSE